MVGDIVLSNLSQARNWLIPSRLAYYIPRFKGKPILPDNWTAPKKLEEGELEFITPAIVTVPYNEKAPSSQGGIAGTSSKGSTSAISESELRNILETMPEPLSFVRVRISPESTRVFGSVTPQDIAAAFQERFNLSIPKEAITGRLKDIGVHNVMVSFSEGIEPIEIKVAIKDI